MSEMEYSALQDALASASMEGYPVTKQTELDCVRLLNGSTSVAALVQEIIARGEIRWHTV